MTSPSRVWIFLLGAAFLFAHLAGGARADYLVSETGSFYVGGRTVTLNGLPKREVISTAGIPPFIVDPNGQFEVEQMYVQFVRLANPKARYPLLLWHGGGLTGVTYETKPDGKPGWQQFFLDHGHDVYVSDAVERGRASWARFPEIFKSEPFFRTEKEAWELFRIGPTWDADPAKRVAFPGVQFPVEAFDQFAKESVPRWTTNDAATQSAYDALVEKTCPCVIVVHSQGGNFAFTAALHNPSKIKAIVAVETSGAPLASTDLARLKDIPFLFVWGDNQDSQPYWKVVRANIDRFANQLKTAGARVDVLDLPAEGVKGNTHMLMMDKNSDDVATRIQAWMGERSLMK